MVIPFISSSEIVKELVPEPLVPNSDSMVLLSLSRANASGFGQYHEMILDIPSTLDDTSGRYTVYLYLDGDSPIAAGREIWGFPKKEARVTHEENHGLLTGTVERGGITLVSASMELAELGNVEELPPMMPFFSLKLIPSVKEDALPDVAQLTSTDFEIIEVKQVYKGNASITFGTSPADPLHLIPVNEVLEAVYMNFDGTLAYGDVIYDYLTED